MESTEKIILSESLNKSSKNENMSLNAIISGKKQLLPEDGIEDVVDIYEEYLRERENSNKFRLVVNINPFCTNALFNPFTEIVKYDSNNDKIILLNYYLNDGLEIDKNIIVGKNKKEVDGEIVDVNFKWTAYDAIRDTQLSNSRCGFVYYCGLDIFNNHLLRNRTFKTVNYSNKSEILINDYSDVYSVPGYRNNRVQEIYGKHMYIIPEDFNTIDDYMRDRNGVIVSDYKLSIFENDINKPYEQKMPLHLYQKHDVYTFKDCIKYKLKEQNGWFGFKNETYNNSLSYKTENSGPISSSAVTVTPNDIYAECGESKNIELNINLTESNPQDGSELEINKVINNRNRADFIDMYPTRELFSFSPLYNSIRKRYEKNWNYCLTYPSSSITKQFNGDEFTFFHTLSDGTIALKTALFDEYTVDDDGRDLITIYSICSHGLKEGDNVNIYKGEELFHSNLKVVHIVDKYVFQVYKDSANISNLWINIDEIEWDSNGEAEITVGDDEHKVKIKKYGRNIISNGKIYRIAESNRCNIDPEAQTVSFKRVFNDIECDYYVRVFSRLPNFKFADAEINDYNLYEDKELDLINRYSNPSDSKCNFENHISDMSFAQTSYGDKDTEIVFTDDIDVSFLKDNLGRPLSDIYLTIVKNNKGYKEWYGVEKEGGIGNINSKDIEYSHCFGYNSSSFLFNEYYRNTDFEPSIDSKDLLDVRDICKKFQRGLKYSSQGDEIVFDETKDFYGDICCYCHAECDEYTLQSVMNRFNTVQRELRYYGSDYNVSMFKSLKEDDNGTMFFDEIINDENSIITGPTDLYKRFNIATADEPLHHSTFHDRNNEEVEHRFKNMLDFKEGYYYKSHYRVPLKTVSMSISRDDGITYDIFSIEPDNGSLKIKTVHENNLSLNDKLTLYNKTKNKFYYLTVSEIVTKFYFKCVVKNEDLSEGFNDSLDNVDEVVLVKRKQGTPEYAKLIKDGSCTYYWRNILSNGIERNDSKIYPFTNGAFYINRQINFFLRRQDSEEVNLSFSTEGAYEYAPKSVRLTDEYYENIYYDSEEIETC